MPLPSDFDETLARVQKLGITAEEPGKIRDHLVLAISTVAEQGQKSGDLAVGDLGFLDWSTKTLRRCEEAIHDEVCDEAKGQLKEEYKSLMDKDVAAYNKAISGSGVTPLQTTGAPPPPPPRGGRGGGGN